MNVNGKNIKNPFKIRGKFSWVINGDDVAIVAKVVNANADILEQAMIKIEQLETEINALKNAKANKNLVPQ